MVQINFAQKQVNAKVVYYGPGMSGKTTNLEVVHQRAPEENRGELTSISTDGDRTLFFDFMPLDLGTVAGMKTCFQIYTVPGQVYYNSTRKLVLQGVDGVIFIADSSASMVEENLESLRNLEANMLEYGRSLDDLPMVIQYNKRDLTDALSLEVLEEKLNPRGVPSFEATAHTGQGVFPTLKALAASVLENIHRQQESTLSTAAPARGLAVPEPSAPQPVAPAVEQAAGAAAVAQPPAWSGGVSPAHDLPAVASRSTPLPPPPAAASAQPRTSISLAGVPPAPLTGAPSGVEEQAVALSSPSLPLTLAPASAMPSPARPSTVAPLAVPASPAAFESVALPNAALAHAAAPPAVEVRHEMEPEPDCAPPPPPAPVSHSFGTDAPPLRRPVPRPTPVASRRHRSALVTGAIVIASVGLGAVLGSLALSLLQ